MTRGKTLPEKNIPLPTMLPDPQSKDESEAKARSISEKVKKASNNESPMNLCITVRSHVFQIPKDIAVKASKLFAKAWEANPTARRITFTVEDKDGEDTDADPENFYTVDAIAHLVGHMYGNDLGCPTSDVDRHTGCLVAWCKVHKFALYFEMELACEGALARIEKCLCERKYHGMIPTVEEIVVIYSMTREGSEVRECLVGTMIKMGKLWNVVNEDCSGDSRDYLGNWGRSSSAMAEFQEAIWMGM